MKKTTMIEHAQGGPCYFMVDERVYGPSQSGQACFALLMRIEGKLDRLLNPTISVEPLNTETKED